MAQLFPFRAFRYNPARVRLADVVTQPYDKISPAMQERYYAASPGNLVRIVLGKREPGDSEHNNVYTRAAACFHDWRRNGIFRQDDAPSFYAYSQRFVVPGTSGPEYERHGFVGAGRLEEYDAGVIFRHEQTLSAPKADRLNLLRATGAHFEQIFMLYSDPARRLDSLLFASAAEPDIHVEDEYGVRHCLWKVSDAEIVGQVQAFMRDRRLIIADGHHRYETALNYRNERRAHAAEAGCPPNPDAPYERMMMTFVNMDAEGLVILPTHRVVFGLPQFDVVGTVERLRPYFGVDLLPERVTPESAVRLLAQKGADTTALLAVTAAGDFILEARDGAADALMAGLSPRQRRLDVAKLHKIVLEHVLGICEEDIRHQKHINYVREAREAIERVREGANVAFLMNPVTVQQMRDVAFAGEVMPQKSTDFYPKLLSGLTVYALE
ncbi:MAG: DUF1015 domain-containing protein [Terriglobales bacterium]